MVQQLQPWLSSIRKRQVKIRDSGLLHQLPGIATERELLKHPKPGASWEGFAIEQVLTVVSDDQAFFWATRQGAEIDLILQDVESCMASNASGPMRHGSRPRSGSR